MKKLKLTLKLLVVGLLLASCSNDDNAIVAAGKSDYSEGIIISSEGNFGDKDGSISYVNNDLENLATNFIYTGVNNAQLGGLIQSIAFTDTDAYIMLNDANTVVVADRYTFKKKTEITSGLGNPRYMAVVDGKGYVTNWGEGSDATDDYIAVIDLATNTILESEKISLDEGVEQILAKDKKLYVTHKGAWSTNNIISVVDLADNNKVTKITVNDKPDEIFLDNSGNLVVLCEGKPLTYGPPPFYTVLTNTTSSITFVNTSDNTVSKTIAFPENQSAGLMYLENEKIYYYKKADKKVYSINVTDNELATDGIDVDVIYGMSVKDNNLYTTLYAFTKLSKLSVIDLTTKEEKYSSAVGLGASKIYFN